MDAWHFLVLSAGKTPCPKNSFFLGGGGGSGFLERVGVEVPIYFDGRGDFSENCKEVSIAEDSLQTLQIV